MIEFAWLLALAAALMVGLLAVVIQLPGTWLILAAAVGYGWHDHFKTLTPLVLGLLAGAAVLAEVLELLPSLWLTKRAGASRRAGWFGLLGGIVGMFLLTLPVPIIGTIFGGVAGCFFGALIGELTLHDNVDGALRVGSAAALGRIVGLVAKLGLALAMSGCTLVLAIWRHV